MKVRALQIVFIVCLAAACNKKNENRIVFQDGFSSNQGWPVGNEEGYSYGFNNGKYEMKIDTVEWYSWVHAPYSGAINFNYSIKVDCALNLKDNSKVAAAGFIFNHIDNNNFAVAIITNNGFCTIFQIKNGTFNSIKNWTNTSAITITAGSINKLEIIQRASTVDFLINNQSVGSFPMNRINAAVKVGFWAQTQKEANFSPVVASFDNFIVSAIQ